MFEYSFVPSGRTRRPLLAVVACIGEAAFFGGLILISLFFGQTLPEHTLFSALMLAPVPTAPPSPPPPMAAAKKIPRAAPAPRMFTTAGLVSPVVVPKVVAIINEAPALDMDAVVGGVPGGIPGVPGGTGSFSNVLSVAPPPPPPPPKAAVLAPPPPPPTPTQISVGGDVQAALIVQQVQPVYPRLARQGHIHGTVELKAVIGTDGRIKDLKVLSGHPLLVEAAMNAVRRWVYRPTILNGVPVEVNTEIEVRFGLSART